MQLSRYAGNVVGGDREIGRSDELNSSEEIDVDASIMFMTTFMGFTSELMRLK